MKFIYVDAKLGRGIATNYAARGNRLRIVMPLTWRSATTFAVVRYGKDMDPILFCVWRDALESIRIFYPYCPYTI